MATHIHIHASLPSKKVADRKSKDAQFSVRNTAPDTWRVFENGKAVSVAGPFKTSAEASNWVKSNSKDAATKDKFYMTPKGSVSAESLEEAAKKKDVPLESVFVMSNGLHGCPARAKPYYKDAGFDRREYSPREWNRLQGEIKEVQAHIKELKSKKTVPPFQLKNEELVLEKLKKEQAKYRTDDSDPSLELAYAVERDPKAVGTKAKKKFKSESEFLAALLKGGMSRGERCVQEALKAYRTDDAALRKYNVEIVLPDGSKKVEKLEFPAGKEGGYGGVIKYEIQKRYPGAKVWSIVERSDSLK